MASESFGFQAEISQLLDLIISVYLRFNFFVPTGRGWRVRSQIPSTPTRRSSFVNWSLTALMPSIKSDTPPLPTPPFSSPRRNSTFVSSPTRRTMFSPSGILVSVWQKPIWSTTWVPSPSLAPRLDVFRVSKVKNLCLDNVRQFLVESQICFLIYMDVFLLKFKKEKVTYS